MLASKKLDIPVEWYHNPTIKDNYGNTVAMYLGK